MKSKPVTLANTVLQRGEINAHATWLMSVRVKVHEGRGALSQTACRDLSPTDAPPPMLKVVELFTHGHVEQLDRLTTRRMTGQGCMGQSRAPATRGEARASSRHRAVLARRQQKCSANVEAAHGGVSVWSMRTRLRRSMTSESNIRALYGAIDLVARRSSRARRPRSLGGAAPDIPPSRRCPALSRRNRARGDPCNASLA